MLTIRRAWVRGLVAAGALALAAGPALGGGFELQENGARAFGMANAFTGTADDSQAAFYNPAGAARQEGLSGSASLTWVDPHMYHATDEGAQGMKNQRASSRAIFLPAFQGSFGMGLTDRLRLGVTAGGFAPFGLELDWGRTEEWGGRFSITEAGIQVVENNVSVGLEFDVTDTISVGGAVGGSLVYGALQLNRKIDFPFLTGGAVSEEGFVKIKMDTSEDDLEFRWNVAGMVRLLRSDEFENGRVRIGVSYRDGIHSIRAKGRAEVLVPDAVRAQFFATGTGNRTKLRVRLPGNVRVGVGVDVTKDLTVGFDWRWTNWSVMKEFELKSEIAGLDGQELVFQYRDTMYYGLGAEYRIMNWDDDAFGLAVRAGGFYDETPIPRREVRPILPDQDRLGFTVGFGIEPIEGFTFDFGYMGFAAKTFTNKNADPETSTSGLGKYTLWTNLFQFSIGLRL